MHRALVNLNHETYKMSQAYELGKCYRLHSLCMWINGACFGMLLVVASIWIWFNV